MSLVDMAASFYVIDRAAREPSAPSWASLGEALGLVDERWHEHDPRDLPPHEVAAWESLARSVPPVGALWLGIENFGDRVVVDPVGYASIDATNFPKSVLWHGDHLPSRDLSAFNEYAREPLDYDKYSYVASLAWLAMSARLRVTTRPLLAGFGDGDYFVF